MAYYGRKKFSELMTSNQQIQSEVNYNTCQMKNSTYQMDTIRATEEVIETAVSLAVGKEVRVKPDLGGKHLQIKLVVAEPTGSLPTS